MNIGINIKKRAYALKTTARQEAANDLISMSIKIDQMIANKYIDSLDKYDLRDANNCIKKAIRRITPQRSISDLLGEAASRT